MTLAYRLATPADWPFVFGNWLSSFKFQRAAGVIPMDIYGEVYTEAINRLLRRPGCDVLVAYKPDEVEGMADLYGFLCAERSSRGPVIHYVYVRESQRREGIARGMFEAAGFDPVEPFVYTFWTSILDKPKLKAAIAAGRLDPLAGRFETAWQEDRST